MLKVCSIFLNELVRIEDLVLVFEIGFDNEISVDDKVGVHVKEKTPEHSVFEREKENINKKSCSRSQKLR